MKANRIPIIKIKRKDCSVAERVDCPRLGHEVLTAFCKRCSSLHFTVEDDYVKCIYGL